jgi:hypothetical protein
MYQMKGGMTWTMSKTPIQKSLLTKCLVEVL